MNTWFIVRSVPVRDGAGTIRGWVRCDVLADGSKPTDTLYLRDGMAYGQAEALERVQLDPGLLYETDAEAVQDGIARLRLAEALGQLVPVPMPRREVGERRSRKV